MADLSKAGQSLARLRINVRKIIYRCPRGFKFFAGPLLGGIIGLIGGIPGFLIGLLLGFLLRELFAQFFLDKKILDYLENPGSQQFYEGESGLAAWCALGVLVAAADSVLKDSSARPEEAGTTRIVKQVSLRAAFMFKSPRAEPRLAEYFSRLALSRKDSLNPDLLAESFAARRALLKAETPESGPADGSGNLASGLVQLAGGKKGLLLAREIRLVIEPGFEAGPGLENSGPGPGGDPWKILGLAPGTPPREIKAHYRRLAKQFHPDELQILNENQREAAARAFMAIKEAYKEIAG